MVLYIRHFVALQRVDQHEIYAATPFRGRTWTSFDLKRARAWSRWLWLRSPWIASDLEERGERVGDTFTLY